MTERDYTIVVGRDVNGLLGFVDATQKAAREEIGFLPMSWLEQKAEAGQVAVILVAGEPAGFVSFGVPRRDQPFRWFQVAIDYSLRRQTYGAALAEYVENVGVLAGARDIWFKCAADIDANAFWLARGYSCVDHITGGIRRSRILNVYYKALRPTLCDISIEPAQHEVRTEVWKPASGLGLSPWHRLSQAELQVVMKREACPSLT